MGVHPPNENPATAPVNGTTLEELLALVSRMAANEPHARCRVAAGPLAPLAEALNHLADQLATRHTRVEDAFGVQALIEQSPNIMFTCDVNARIRFLNFTIPGQTVADVVGANLYDFIAPESLENARTAIQRVLATGVPDGYEARPAANTGAEWYAARVGPIKVGQEIVGFTVILTDITDLKRTQLRLEQSNRELESFAYVASHDLQEPLRKIQTFGERLKATSAAALGPEGLGYLERMYGASTRMRRLIDDLLSFSRVASKAQPFARVDLAEIARDVVGDLEAAIEKEGATITLGTLPVFEADPMQMRQLLQNLVSNALKFRREDVAPAISIHGTEDARTGRCELVVQDNGIGFDEKYIDRIFNVFQRLHGRTSKYEGTGIGLAICRKIAERHGGSITAHSSPGEGAAFIVTLPLVQHSDR
ncbi:PAS domain S-box protein [Archangium violaceum]|nr:PAS domain S-box protein [Archangium violaceum]